MTYELGDFSQTAVDTALSAGIIAGDITTIDATTGWPTGGANGPFFAMIDYDVAGKELVLVTSRTGNTLQNVARGQGGTPAAAHSAGAKIRHIHTARDADEANYAVSQTVGAVTTKGDLLAATAANTLARRPVGANNQVLIADSAQADGIRWGLLTAASLGTDSVGADEPRQQRGRQRRLVGQRGHHRQGPRRHPPRRRLQRQRLRRGWLDRRDQPRRRRQRRGGYDPGSDRPSASDPCHRPLRR